MNGSIPLSDKYKRVIGYEWLDNVITGFLLGVLAIVLFYFLQEKYYHVDQLGVYGLDFKIPFLKRALIGTLLVFLIMNYLDKLYAMRGVLLALIIAGIYLVKEMFF